MRRIKEYFHHLFIPRESNNHRSKLLHHSSLLFLVAAILLLQVFQVTIERNYPDILGISHSVTSDELLLQTNIKRQENGLSVLQMNPELAKAAAAKAQHMMSNNYWAHNAPDGTTPWVFIKDSGYEYVFAGENLARGFTSATDVINAWMASPGHRENMLSKNYSDIGFAIVTGTLNGDETVLIVEMFGSRLSPFVAKETTGSSISVSITPAPTVAFVAKSAVSPTIVPVTLTPIPTTIDENIPQAVVASVEKPLLDTKKTSKNVSLVLVGILLGVLLVDLWVTEKNRVVRAVAHNLDHIVFLSIIFLAVLLFTRGLIL